MALYPHLMKHASVAALGAALLATTAGTATAAMLTVNDISVAGANGFSLVVPSVEAVDSNLDEAEIRALFSGDFGATDVTDLDAASIRIPELTLSIEVPDAEGEMESSVIVYRDVEFTDIVDGVAASSVVGSAEVQGSEEASFTFGRMSTGLFDLGGVLAFYGVGAASGDGAAATASARAMTPLYRDFVFEGATFTAPGFSCEIGTATIAEFSARPMEASLADLMVAAQELEAAEAAGEKPSPEAIASLVGYYADFFTAFESTPAEMSGLSCSGTDDEGEAIAVTTGPLVMGGFAPGIYPQLALNDFRLDGPDEGWMKLDNFTWKEMDFTAPLATLEAAGADLDEAWLAANWRNLIPAIAGFSLTGFALDIADPEEAGNRIAVSIGAFDASFGDYVNGVPATFATTAENIEFVLPRDAETAALVALGIDRLDLGSEISTRWDEATQTIAVETLMISAADLGRIGISGTIANATPALFSADAEVAAAALTELTVTDMRIDIENNGILPVLVTLAAMDEGQDPAALHGALVGMGTALPIGLLGATPDSIEVGTSIAAFLSGTPQLTLNITSKDPAGVGLADFMAAETDPTALTGKINVTATTSGEPQALVFPAVPDLPEEPAADDEAGDDEASDDDASEADEAAPAPSAQ